MVHIHHPWWCISTTSNRDGFFFARQWAMMNRSINDKERKSGNDNKGERVKKVPRSATNRGERPCEDGHKESSCPSKGKLQNVNMRRITLYG